MWGKDLELGPEGTILVVPLSLISLCWARAKLFRSSWECPRQYQNNQFSSKWPIVFYPCKDSHHFSFPSSSNSEPIEFQIKSYRRPTGEEKLS